MERRSADKADKALGFQRHVMPLRQASNDGLRVGLLVEIMGTFRWMTKER